MYREYYSNDDGEPMGYGTVYDDGPDPEDFYSRWDYQDETDPADYDDSEPERCEMDMKDGTVCQRVLAVDGYCGNENEHA